jgi:conjugative transfer signal peptidase TraF
MKAMRRQRHVMTTLCVGLLLLTCPKVSAPTLLWNFSPSVPLGLYRLAMRPPTRGTLAVIRLPEPLFSLANARGYLPAGTLLIKWVAAGSGDVVCRHGSMITINGRTVAYARTTDASGRPLPRWAGCRRLRADQAFVLSAVPDSFDSRYFGSVERRHVLGTALPVWAAAPT